MVVLIVGLFAITYTIDRRVAAGLMVLPAWLSSGGPDVVREVLIAIATSVITVAGVVFSITILVLQLASQQFGPRMLRNFIRDTGTQVSLGAFVATFVFSVLTLQVVSDPPELFVPHLSTSVAVALVLIDLGVLIYFIDHVAISIQLTSVVSASPPISGPRSCRCRPMSGSCCRQDHIEMASKLSTTLHSTLNPSQRNPAASCKPLAMSDCWRLPASSMP
jgi:hypothetical protein